MKPKYPPRSSTLLGPGEVPRPVIGLDIDGSMGYYHDHFIRFAANWLGRDIRLRFDGSQSLASHIGVSKATYRKMKLAYRKGGFKRWMPARNAASIMTKAARERGAEIIICTTRPYLTLENIDDDTQEWLKRNDIPYDEIIWGENKYRDLTKARPGRVVAVLEDLAGMADQAVQCGVKNVIVPHTSYVHNHMLERFGDEEPSKFTFVENLYEASMVIQGAIMNYEDQHTN